jgi:hypothetical protein
MKFLEQYRLCEKVKVFSNVGISNLVKPYIIYIEEAGTSMIWL